VDRAKLSHDSLELAQDNYELARDQFESGLITGSDFLIASVAVTTARVAEAKARSDARLGILALENVMGL
jgi:outer membrane protein TolC